jgi:hypothetical protein
MTFQGVSVRLTLFNEMPSRILLCFISAFFSSSVDLIRLSVSLCLPAVDPPGPKWPKNKGGRGQRLLRRTANNGHKGIIPVHGPF